MAETKSKADPEAEGTQPADDRPSWLPERYDRPEQLAEAYSAAERKITELSERAKQADSLEENYAALSAQVDQLQQQSQTQAQAGAADPMIAAYTSAMEVGDYTSALAIQAQVSQMAANQAVSAALQKELPQVTDQVKALSTSQQNEIAATAANNLRAQYGEDFIQAETAMQQLIVDNPNLYPERAHYDVNAARAAYENVYKIVTYGKQPVAVDTTQEKMLAQSAQGAGGRALTPDQEAEEWASIQAAKPKEYWQ